MCKFILPVVASLLALASSVSAFAAETVLLNGKDLEGWSFHVDADEKVQDVNAAWRVHEGMLVSLGTCNSYLKHGGEFENYVLTFEWSAIRQRNGVTVSSPGSVLVHTIDEKGSFGYPKSVEVSLRDIGAVFLRDVDTSNTDTKEWAFHAPDFADDAENDLGEWNRVKLICRGNRLTVLENGKVANQIDRLNRTKGAIAIRTTSGSFPAPMLYRNFRVRPIDDSALQDEQNAKLQLASFKAALNTKRAAEEAKRRELEQREKMKAAALAKKWSTIEVKQEVPFTDDVLKLPIPKGARDLAFDATFGDVELTSAYSLEALSKFYRTEMARRGWQETEKDRDEDSIEITFQHKQCQVELRLSQGTDGVEIEMDCRGLSFAGTNNPAGLAAAGIPQPKAYLFLQKEIALPAGVHDLEYDSGNRCLFKSDLALQDAFDHLTKQLLNKGYRETRRPIVSSNRRYSEFAKAGVEISVNVFAHNGGSRAILTYEEGR